MFALRGACEWAGGLAFEIVFVPTRHCYARTGKKYRSVESGRTSKCAFRRSVDDVLAEGGHHCRTREAARVNTTTRNAKQNYEKGIVFLRVSPLDADIRLILELEKAIDGGVRRTRLNGYRARHSAKIAASNRLAPSKEVYNTKLRFIEYSRLSNEKDQSSKVRASVPVRFRTHLKNLSHAKLAGSVSNAAACGAS